MEISKKDLEKVITEAVNSLKEAGEYNSYSVKIYLNENKLGFEVQQANWGSPDLDYIFSFPYVFPYYGGDSRGSVKYMLESGMQEHEITTDSIKEWDWSMFCESERFNKIERLIEEAISSINSQQLHEVVDSRKLVTFHIGRGGRFHNGGYKTFVGEDKKISEIASSEGFVTGYKNESTILARLIEDIEDFNISFFLDLLSNREVDKIHFLYDVRATELGGYGFKDDNGEWLDIAPDDITGVMELDTIYDTTIVKYLDECTEEELELIEKSTNYKSSELLGLLNEINNG